MIAVVGRPGFVPSIEESLLAPPGPSERPAAPAGVPDMFVYLVDGYPGATASAQAPWFDATAFPAALSERGFTVHDDSRTNYLLTRLVIPTMLEGRHVVDIAGLAPPSGPDQAVDARRLRSVTEHAAGLAAIPGGGLRRGLGETGRGSLSGGVGLPAIGDALGFAGLTDKEFLSDDGPGMALMSAMYDLDQVGLVKFQNVSHGNALTPNGRDVLPAGLVSVWPEVFEIPASEAERAFLARLHAASLTEGDGWADLRFVDADAIYADSGFPTGEYADAMARFEFLGDLDRKRLIRAKSRAMGSPNLYRRPILRLSSCPRRIARHGAARAGLIDWSVPTPGFETMKIGDSGGLSKRNSTVPSPTPTCPMWACAAGVCSSR